MQQILINIALVLANYLVGSISSAILIARFIKKVDIRTIGHKKAGGSNVAEYIGFKWGIVVGVFDFLKGIPLLLIARELHVEENWQGLIAIAAVAGHCWPLWFQFKGGRGVATSLGVMIILTPRLGLITILINLLSLPVFFIRKISYFQTPLLSSPILTLVGNTVYCILTLKSRSRVDELFAFLLFMLIIIRRITARTEEYKAYPPVKLFISRLLFDNSEVV